MITLGTPNGEADPSTTVGPVILEIFNAAQAEFGPSLTGLLIGGSTARGNAREDSDIDAFLIFQGTWRQRRRVVINNRDVDLFINPAEVVLSSIRSARDDVLVENYADGWIVYDPDDVVEEIQSVAKLVLAQPWRAPTHLEVFVSSNQLKDTLKAFLKSSGMGYVAQRYLLNRFIEAAISAYYLFARRIRPAPKLVPADLALRAEDVYHHLSTLLAASGATAEQLEAAELLCDAVFARCESARSCFFGPKLSAVRRTR